MEAKTYSPFQYSQSYFLLFVLKRVISIFATLSEILLVLSQKESYLRPLLRVLSMALVVSWMFRRPVSSAK